MISIGDALLKLGVDKTGLEKGMKEAERSVQVSMKSIQQGLMAAGAAFTAVGVAGMKMVGDAKRMNAELGQTALTLGVSTKEMRTLALATTDVTFPLKSVAATFELLAKAGVTNTDGMRNAAKAFDGLADATGSSADAMADLLLPAFKLFGKEIPQTTAELDKFTWLQKKTLVDVSDFGTLLTRMAPYMDDLDMSMEDAIATLAALGEQGIVGTAATLKLRTAITQAASGTVTLNEALGLSQEEIDGFKKQMTDATGITEKYAAVANTQFTIIDKVKQKIEEFSLSVGSTLEPLEGMFGAMTALGPAMIGITLLMPKLKAAFIGLKAIMLGVKLQAIAMWGAITLGISLVIAGAIALWQNWDKVQAFLKKAWDNIKMFFLQGIASVLDGLSKFTKFIPGLNKLVDSAKEKIQGMIDAEEVKKDAQEAIRVAEQWAEEQKKLAEETTATKKAELQKQRDDAKSTYDKEVDELRKTYGVLEDYDKKYQETKMDAARRARQEREKEIDREMDALRKAHDESIRLIDEEYNARLKLIDEQAAAEIAQLNREIDNIRKAQEREDKAREVAANAERKADLERAVEEAKTDEERATAEKRLAEFITEQEIKARREQRNAAVDSLREQIDAVRTSAQQQRDTLKEETDVKKKAEQEKLDATLATLRAEKEGLDTALQETLERLEVERREAERVAQDRCDKTLARIAREEEVLDKQLEDELKKIADHVDAVNAETARLKDRTITITTVHRTVTEGGGGEGVKWTQHGFHGIVQAPTLFGVGEGGAERVDITPVSSGGVFAPTASPQTANIIIMLDGRVIGRAIGQPLVDEIRVKTGVRI